ncbi:MAG: hypothetical protein LBQ22_11075 [Bacteroidales bacterium]|jgi:hypothetical protein|nr:hypothetical protein [Bacteroidales bacterium]
MIKSFLKIRFVQIYRSIKEIGSFRIIFLAVLFFLGIYALYTYCNDYKNSFYITAGFIVIITLLHISREDSLFLKVSCDNYKQIYFTEYLLYSTPLILCLLINKQWIQFLIIPLALSIIVNLEFKFKPQNKNYKILKLIPDRLFEWKSGVRRYLYVIIIIWIAGFIGSFFIATVPVTIFIFGIIPVAFYSMCEPYQMIIIYEMKASRFLFTKIKYNLIAFSILVLPLITMFIIFHTDVWYIVIAEYIIFLSVHTYQILTKYAFYEPNEKYSAAQIFEILGILGLLIPLFLPLVWLLSIYFYFKSKERLKIYLNDYN